MSTNKLFVIVTVIVITSYTQTSKFIFSDELLSRIANGRVLIVELYSYRKQNYLLISMGIKLFFSVFIFEEQLTKFVYNISSLTTLPFTLFQNIY